MTNIERIRSMSAEELAKEMNYGGNCKSCRLYSRCADYARKSMYWGCTDTMLTWLNEEADNG